MFRRAGLLAAAWRCEMRAEAQEEEASSGAGPARQLLATGGPETVPAG